MLGVSTSTLFVAAVVPGTLILISIMLTNAFINRRRNYENAGQSFSISNWLDAIWDGKYALTIPFIILGGIYSGIFTPTEAASVAVVTTLTFGFALKTINLSDLPKMLISSAKVNGVILPTVALSLPLAEALGALNIPQWIIENVLAMTDNYSLIILIMLLFFIIAGCVMEAVPNIVLMGPVLFPLAQEIGMHDIHFCIVMVTALGIGFITPPIGLNLFVISGVTGESIMDVAKHAFPFVFSMLCVAIALAYIPALSLAFIN